MYEKYQGHKMLYHKLRIERTQHRTQKVETQRTRLVQGAETPTIHLDDDPDTRQGNIPNQNQSGGPEGITQI